MEQLRELSKDTRISLALAIAALILAWKVFTWIDDYQDRLDALESRVHELETGGGDD